jgi:hypothetical protein
MDRSQDSQSGLGQLERLFLEAPRAGGFPPPIVPDVVKDNDT